MVADSGSQWSVEKLEGRFVASYGVGSDADLPELIRFIRGVTELARSRHARGEEFTEQPVIFVLHPKEPAVDFGARSRNPRVPMLDQGDSSIGGLIWFVNHVVNDGFSVAQLDNDSPATLFSYISRDLGLGSTAAAVVSKMDGEFVVRFYPNGLDDPDTCVRQSLEVSRLDCGEVLDVLDGIWRNELVTPLAQGHVSSTWSDPSKLIPIKEAELLVQRILKIGLTARYLGVFKVHQEHAGASGRFDLLIEQPDPADRSRVTKHVLLELKVLREKRSTGSTFPPAENVAAIRKGIIQAVSYRDEWDVKACALCVFDMRKEVEGSAAFDGVETEAMHNSVDLWIRHLFPDSDSYREYQYAGGS